MFMVPSLIFKEKCASLDERYQDLYYNMYDCVTAPIEVLQRQLKVMTQSISKLVRNDDLMVDAAFKEFIDMNWRQIELLDSLIRAKSP
jgi:hypothetical protein